VSNPEHYKFIKAIVDCGELSWEYQLNRKGAPVVRMDHDESVERWSDGDIIKLTKSMLSVDEDDPAKVKVEYR
jgi:hypothetical protein